MLHQALSCQRSPFTRCCDDSKVYIPHRHGFVSVAIASNNHKDGVATIRSREECIKVNHWKDVLFVLQITQVMVMLSCCAKKEYINKKKTEFLPRECHWIDSFS